MDEPRIADLSAHLGIACRAVHNQFELIRALCGRDGFDHRLGLEKIIAQELRRFDLEIVLGDADDFFPLSFARAGALFYHELFEPYNFDCHATLSGHKFGEVERKAVSVIKLESDVTRHIVLEDFDSARGAFRWGGNPNCLIKLVNASIK